jgi:glycosyltransferase involved in cell wall biosynthesis
VARIVHIVLNAYLNDNRVRRAAECGRDLGCDVTVFALSAPGAPAQERQAGVEIRRFALTSRSWSKSKPVQVLKYVEAAWRMIRAGRALTPDVVHAHDVDGLVIGRVLAAVSGARLIYDAHELWADSAHGASMPRWLVNQLTGIERLCSRRAQQCIAVSESIAAHMAEHQGIPRPVVVRNVPDPWPAEAPPRLRAALGISPETVVVLYQGAIGGEGVFTLARAFRRVTGNAILVILGDGPAVATLRDSFSDLGARIAFHPLVPAAALPSYTRDADIGVHPMAAGYLNHLWALPNKLFEYIQGGLVLVVSDLPEMAGLVRAHDVGLTFPPGNEEALANRLQQLIDDRGLREHHRRAARDAATSLNWTVERHRLEAVYETLIPGPQR